MGKVITSKGLNEFVEKGTVTHVPDHKPQKPIEKPPEAPKAEAAPVEPVEAKSPPEAPKEDDETVPVLSEDSRKYVNKQHRLRKEAEEQAQDAERFAKDQYQRAVLAEQRAEQLSKDLEEHRKPAPKEPELVEPKEDDPQWLENGQFNWRKFTKAQADYAAKKAITDFQKTQADERAQANRVEHETKIRASAEAARKEFSDFDAVMESAKGTEADLVPQFVLNYIYESDHSALLAYHLAKNPEESQRIAKLTPIRGLAELGKLEDKLTAQPPKEVIPEPKLEVVPERTGAPPPITPIATNASGTVNTDPARMSYKELRAFERARRQKR